MHAYGVLHYTSIKMKGIGMVNQQKGVPQETAVVVNVSPSLPISFFHVSMTPFGSKMI